MTERAERWDFALREAGFSGSLATGEPLAPMTTWRIGGPAELLATPRDRDDLIRLVGVCADADIPWRVLGNGSNLLVRDEGVSGLVVRLRRVLDSVDVNAGTVTAGAGVMFPALANLTASRGLAGLEFGAGIPGTVGGAAVMNAGWHRHEFGNFVQQIEFLEADGTIATFDRPACAFGYRSSAFRGREGVVMSARLELVPDDPGAIRARLEEFAASRKRNQPTHLPSCGSVFVQPPGDFAGRLIEAAGLKGRRVGAIEVSPQHANFFVNLGGGTADDVLRLVGLVEDEVERRFGIRLEREFEVW